ncbi:MAG: HAD hydrolase family protein, partial [Chloroflexi bacterium]|nr:HAD hydrolase family protein [Chloroflexota bacterium]
PLQSEPILAALDALKIAFIATHPGGTVRASAEIAHWDFTRISALDMDEAGADALVLRFKANAALHVVKAFLPYNGLWAVDFTRNGVDKSTAARILARSWGIDTRQMIVAGDSYNDLPLLKAAGLRVVMGDAPDELKALADYVAPSVDDDGLAVAIEEFVLPRLAQTS